jgi:hypothetical protein
MEAKSIKEILIKEKNVIIPEIQREYVWGDNRSVLIPFLNDILVNNKEKSEKNIGFLYSYHPNSEDIFLIDGQQRFTTLVLLAFYFALKEGKKENFKELLDLKNMGSRFSYRVRSCTENFLNSLFENVSDRFDKDPSKVITDKTWYLSTFDNDISIKAMLSALDTIHDNCKACDPEYYKFITEEVRFWYFEVEKTSQGEELYITMNSRGESLTPSEQIKPLLFLKLLSEEKLKWGKTWDDWEEFFYERRGDRDISTVDDAMNNFVRTVIELNTCKEHKEINPGEDVAEVTLDGLYSYFVALEKVDKKYPNEIQRFFGSDKNKDERSDAYFYVLKSLLVAYKMDFHGNEREYERIYKIITNGVRRGIINNVPLLKFLESFQNSEESFYDFINSKKDTGLLDNVFDQHELYKVNIYSQTNDEEIEDIFWEAEAHQYTGGLLNCIWSEKFGESKEKWSDGNKDIFRQRFNVFKNLFNEKNTKIYLKQIPEIGKIDNSILARALLSFDDYLIPKRGNNWGFGHHEYWKEIMNKSNSYPIVSSLIKKILSFPSEPSLYERLDKVIKEKVAEIESDLSKKDARYYILKYPSSLQSLYHGYNICCFNGEKWNNYDILILNEQRANSYKINLFRYLIYKNFPKKELVNEWMEFNKDKGWMLDVRQDHALCLRCLKCNEEHMNEVMDQLKKESYKEVEVREQQEDYNADREYIDKYIYVGIDPKDNLIEEGVKIAEIVGSRS